MVVVEAFADIGLAVMHTPVANLDQRFEVVVEDLLSGHGPLHFSWPTSKTDSNNNI